MKTTKETISAQLNAQLDAKKAERAQILAECKREKATAAAKIEAIKAAQAEAESPEAYKKDAAQIHELESYINYLDTRAKTTNAKPLITKEEYNTISGALEAENKKLVDANAAQIFKKLDELKGLLDEYSESANDLQVILNKAQKAHFGRNLGGHLWHALKEGRADPYGVYSNMLLTYFNHRAGELKA